MDAPSVRFQLVVARTRRPSYVFQQAVDGSLQSVQLAKFLVKVVDQRLMRQRLAGDDFDEPPRRVTLAVIVNLLVQPRLERLELTVCRAVASRSMLPERFKANDYG